MLHVEDPMSGPTVANPNTAATSSSSNTTTSLELLQDRPEDEVSQETRRGVQHPEAFDLRSSTPDIKESNHHDRGHQRTNSTTSSSSRHSISFSKTVYCVKTGERHSFECDIQNGQQIISHCCSSDGRAKAAPAKATSQVSCSDSWKASFETDEENNCDEGNSVTGGASDVTIQQGPMTGIVAEIDERIRSRSKRSTRNRHMPISYPGSVLYKGVKDGARLTEWDIKESVVSSDYIRSRKWLATDGEIELTWSIEGAPKTCRTWFVVASDSDLEFDFLIGREHWKYLTQWKDAQPPRLSRDNIHLTGRQDNRPSDSIQKPPIDPEDQPPESTFKGVNLNNSSIKGVGSQTVQRSESSLWQRLATLGCYTAGALIVFYVLLLVAREVVPHILLFIDLAIPVMLYLVIGVLLMLLPFLLLSNP